MRIDTSTVLITEDEINKMIYRVSDAVNDFYGDTELVVIGILTGAYVFTADLVRKLKMPVTVDFMKVKSYQGTDSTGQVTVTKDIETDIKGRNVLIVEDIIDTGNTLKKLKEMLLERQPASVRICTAFDKPDRRVNDLVPDFNGIVIPDKFIVGYGLDFDGQYRNFKDVRIVSFIE